MLLNFSKPYMGSLESPCIKVIPPPPTTTTTTTTTGVTSRPAGLRPQVKREKDLAKLFYSQDNTAFLSAIGGSLGLFLGFSCWESALAAERGASRLCRGLGSWIKRLFERGGEREALDTEGLYRYFFFFCDKGGK